MARLHQKIEFGIAGDLPYFIWENKWSEGTSRINETWHTAYLALPKRHPWYGKHYDDDCFEDVRINGGLTFADTGAEGRNKEWQDDDWDRIVSMGVWILGADWHHLDNHDPYTGKMLYTLDEVREDILALATQAHEVSGLTRA